MQFPYITRTNEDKGMQILEIDQSTQQTFEIIKTQTEKDKINAWIDHTKIFETIEALTHITFAGFVGVGVKNSINIITGWLRV